MSGAFQLVGATEIETRLYGALQYIETQLGCGEEQTALCASVNDGMRECQRLRIELETLSRRMVETERLYYGQFDPGRDSLVHFLETGKTALERENAALRKRVAELQDLRQQRVIEPMTRFNPHTGAYNR